MTQHFYVPSEHPKPTAAAETVMKRATPKPDIGKEAEQRQSWQDIPQLKLTDRRLARSKIVAATRSDPTYIAIDILRTRVMGMIREHGWKTLAITSPRGGCGKTTLTLNLAFSLARQSTFKVGVVDLDLRRPTVARRLNCQHAGALEGFLQGNRDLSQSLLRYGTNLVFAPNTVPVEKPAELLDNCINGQAIATMRAALGLDLIVFDLPPMLAADDALVVLPAVDAMLLVAAAGESTISEIESCERDLSQAEKLAGIVLNKCQYLPDRYGY